MEKKKIEHYKKILQKEFDLLTNELKTVGRINPSNPADWEAVSPKSDIDHADRNEVSDVITDYENNTAILKDLEIRFNEVKDALQKIEDGKFGICETSGEKIEEDRLEANPAARTCKAHMNQK